MLTTMSTAVKVPSSSVVNVLENQVSVALKKNPHLQSRNLRFETSDGRVTLHGQVSTWYQKQMAQEALLRLDGVDHVDNHLQVCWS
jgi:osmotically-inducible protein OsmY